MANRKMFTQVKILSSLGWQDSTLLAKKAKHSKCPGKPSKFQLYKNSYLLPSSTCASGRADPLLQLCLVLARMSSDLPNGVLVLQGSKIPIMVFCTFFSRKSTKPEKHFWFSGFNKVDFRALMSCDTVW